MKALPPRSVAGMGIDDRRIQLAGLVIRRRDDNASTNTAVFRVLPFYFANFPQCPRSRLRIEVRELPRRRVFGPHPNIARRVGGLGSVSNRFTVGGETVFPDCLSNVSEFGFDAAGHIDRQKGLTRAFDT